MSSTILSLLFDCILGVLLIATINYCSKLSRRIRFLQDSRGELATMITQFDHATDRATNSLVELQVVSKKIADALQLKIDKANFLADDLAFLIEKSSKLAAQLEQVKSTAVETNTTKPKPLFETHDKFSKSTFSNPSPSSSKVLPIAEDNSSPQSRATKSLEAALHRLASHQTASNKATEPSVLRMQESLPRTDAERDLVEALKSGRQ